MKIQNYQRELTVQTNVTDAFEAAKQIDRWWTSSLEGTTQKIGDIFTVRFGETWVTFRVTELDPAKRMTWLVEKSHLPWLKDTSEWTDTAVIWEFMRQEQGTYISFVHLGLTPEAECYTNCEKGWDFYFYNSYKKLITGNEGMPDTPSSQR